jgi:hypothetical protein
MRLSVSFAETMRGWLRADDGPELPVSFEVVAQRERAGRFTLRGLIAAPPLVPETPARGTLEMSLGRIAYHLTFVGAGGRPLVLDATKHPSVLAPLRTMTCMLATIRDPSGNVVASGEMRFDVRDLPEFALSWLCPLQRGRRELDTRRRHLERLGLSEGNVPPAIGTRATA